jgi:hypothetical protein
MARVEVARVEEAPAERPAPEAEVGARGEVQTRAVLKGAERPLWLWRHRLPPGAELGWERPRVGHVLYLAEGSATVGGEPVGVGEAVFVEHQARVTLRAGAAGATVLHFHRAGGPGPERAGGNVHVVRPSDGLSWAERPSHIFLDANCPTCTLWLHWTNHLERYSTRTHTHSADEIMVVLRGEMRLGRRALTPGSAIAIDGDTQYGFESGSEGIGFINFRPTGSWYTRIGEHGERGETFREGIGVRV